MKIKEVTQKTNLTDRAIRFYIDNGLVSPGIEENYSGRKNIEFSENDIERLSQIALLRKAGFSISDIKEIISDDVKIEEIVTKFIEESEEEIKNKSEVIEKLKTISFDEKVSLETLCEKLSPTVEEEEVPKEDLEAPRAYKITRKIFKIWGISGLVATGIAITAIMVIDFFFFSYKFPSVLTYMATPAFCAFFFLIPTSMFFSLYKTNTGTYPPKGDRSADVWSSSFFAIIATVLFLFSFLIAGFSSLMLGESETWNPKHYLDVDDTVEDEMNTILQVFPGRIPSSARTSNGFSDSTKYYYYCENFSSLDYKIMAEWELNEEEYSQAKKDADEKEICNVTEEGSWTLLHFIETRSRSLIFAYNDKEKKVRYITSHGYHDEHYYKTLDW